MASHKQENQTYSKTLNTWSPPEFAHILEENTNLGGKHKIDCHEHSHRKKHQKINLNLVYNSDEYGKTSPSIEGLL